MVANHQHEIEAPVIVADLALASFSWREPIYTVSSRRMWEPGFFAERVPWLRFALRGVNLGSLFAAIGMQPIENDLHARPFASIAYSVHARHGDLAADAVFREDALARLPRGARRLSDLFGAKYFAAGRTIVTLSELREPHRSEALAATREQVEADLRKFESLIREGATIFLAPEGSYTGDGRMQRLRGAFPRLAPAAAVWLVGVSYDPFAERRLSMLYRLVRSRPGATIEAQIKAARPVTTSALLGTWLHERATPFSERGALDAITRQLAHLPPALFVDPKLRRNPLRRLRSALRRMTALGMLTERDGDYAPTGRNAHPQFPRTRDTIAYQFNFHAETLDGARRLGESGP